MGSQNASTLIYAIALAFGGACGKPTDASVSSVSLPGDAPDLSLTSVAFARLSEGRVVARGNAEQLDYRRTGGRLVATNGGGVIHPEPGTGLAEFGVLRFSAPRIEGEVQARHGFLRARLGNGFRLAEIGLGLGLRRRLARFGHSVRRHC